MLGISVVLFRGNSSSELNLNSIYLSSQSSEFLVINLMNSLSLLQISYFSAGTSVKYLFPLVSFKYPFTLLKIRYKGFTL